MKRFAIPDSFRRPFAMAMGASAVVNVLTLITPLYMTQIYDRVLSSRSGATLLALTLVTLVVIALLSCFDLLRNLIFARAGAIAHAELEDRVLVAARQTALAGGQGRRGRAMDDLEQVRGFLSGPIPAALTDLAFAPLFFVVLFLIHVWLGVASLVLAALLLAGALTTRRLMQKTQDETVLRQREASDALDAHLATADSAVAMGYAERAEARAAILYRASLTAQMEATVATAGVGAFVRGLRQAAGILILGLAAWLALDDLVSLGAIFAASILFARALAPLDQVLGAWRQLFAARSAWERLSALIARLPDVTPPTALPAPTGAIALAQVVAGAPGSQIAILKGVSLDLPAGRSLGVVGPSGSGKSTLARVMTGAWPVARGTVRIDGAELAQYDRAFLGQRLGYLPQSVELLPGTIAENIGRFDPEPDPSAIVRAATAAGAHEMILGLPQGYDTPLGQAGFALSGGQRQRIGLARALYGEPMLVVLDEPDTGLDVDGERALTRAIAALRQRNATVVVIAHRPALVSALDDMLVLRDGQVAKFGPTQDVLPQLIPIPGGRARA